MWWLGIGIGVGFGLLIWFLIWLWKRNPAIKMDMWLSMTRTASEAAGAIIAALDKDPDNESTAERFARYAALAVANIEQSFKHVKAELIAADGDITKLHQTMKDKAWDFVVALAKADDVKLAGEERGIIGGLIEAALYFLPKPGANQELVVIETREPVENDTNGSGDTEAGGEGDGFEFGSEQPEPGTPVIADGEIT
jgi:hypothetical protein